MHTTPMRTRQKERACPRWHLIGACTIQKLFVVIARKGSCVVCITVQTCPQTSFFSALLETPKQPYFTFFNFYRGLSPHGPPTLLIRGIYRLHTRNIWTDGPYMDILPEIYGPYGPHLDFLPESMDCTVHI